MSIFLFIILFSSCNFPEHYFSPEPECEGKFTFEFGDSDYLILLESKSPEDYRYFFKSFTDENYMIVNFRNKATCFDVKMLVQKWDKLAGMKRTNGKSYPKELYDLKWEIKKGKYQYDEIVYLDMHDIID